LEGGKKLNSYSIGNLSALHFAAALLYLPLKTDDNPNGQYSEAELYKTLTDLTWFVFSDSDPTKSWEHRREAKKSIDKLGEVMVEEIKKFKTPIGIWDKLTGGAGVRPPPPSLKDYGSNLVKRLLSGGRSAEDVAWMLLWSGCAFVANSACAVGIPLPSFSEEHPADIGIVRPIDRLLPRGR